MSSDNIRSSSNLTENLEIFSLVWLDPDIHKDIEGKAAQQHLRSTINQVQIFNTSEECEEYVRRVNTDRIVLIVNEELREEFVPKIDGLQQLSAIYIYAQNHKPSKGSITKSNKVI